MKKFLLLSLCFTIKISAFSQTVDLNGVTLGFAAGYNINLSKVYDYSLSPGSEKLLNIQPLSRGSFGIS
jgi:hypothetical protein